MNLLVLIPLQQEPFLNNFFIACLAGGVLLVTLFMVTSAIRIVPEYARMATFRLGRFVGAVGPGIVFLLPLIDRGVMVDLRHKNETITGDFTTSDEARVSSEMLLRYRVVSPEKSVLMVADLADAVRKAGLNSLKTAISHISFSDLRFERTRLEGDVKARLAEVMDSWGCEVITVEISEMPRG